MLEALKPYKTFLGAVALILAPILVYRANVHDPTRRPPLDRVILVLSTPLELLLDAVVGGVSDAYSRYVDGKAARVENIELRREALRLQRELDALSAVEEENARLRTLLGLSERNPKLQLVAAKVIAASTSALERTVRIDKGLAAGVSRGMTVLADRGLVGRVQRAGYSWADVTVIADEKLTLDVVLGKSRVRGRMRGTGLWPRAKLDIQDVPRTEEVRLGDIISTSGLAGVFPPGIPVARVAKVDAVAGGLELIIEAEPLVALARVEEVSVVVGPPSEEEPLVTPESLLPPELQATRSTTTSTGAP